MIRSGETKELCAVMLSAKTSNDSEVEVEAENERQYNGDDTPKPELNDVGSQNVLSKKIWL